MKANMQVISRLALAAVLFLGVAGDASAQPAAWPSRPVKVIVPFAAGGTVDTVSRYLAERLGAPLGQPLIIDNRPGIVGRLTGELDKFMTEPATALRLHTLGAEPAFLTGQAFVDFMVKDSARWAKVIRDAGVTVN